MSASVHRQGAGHGQGVQSGPAPRALLVSELVGGLSELQFWMLLSCKSYQLRGDNVLGAKPDALSPETIIPVPPSSPPISLTEITKLCFVIAHEVNMW